MQPTWIRHTDSGPVVLPPACGGGACLFAAGAGAVYSGPLLSSEKVLGMKSEKISELTTSRLSVYLRCLNLLAAAGD